MIFLHDQLVLTRDYLDQADADNSDWTDTELTRYLAQEQNYLATKIRNRQQDFFGKRYTFALTSGTIEYYLPRNIISPRFVEIITAGVTGTAPFFTVDEDDRTFEVVLPVGIDRISNIFPFDDIRRKFSRVSFERYSIFGNKLIFTPGKNLSGHVRVWFTSYIPSTHYGTAAAAGSSTLTLASTPTVGLREYGDNIYEGMFLGIYSGTGVGQIREITQYVESTRVATVDKAWDTTPTGAVYSILTPIPEQMAELLALGASIRARGRLQDSSDEFVGMYSAMSGEYLDEVDPRIRQGVRHVRNA